MAFFVYPLLKEYQNVFGSTPEVEDKLPDDQITDSGSRLLYNYLGREIWLPILFTDLDPTLFPATDHNNAGELLLPFCTISFGLKKEWIKTPLSQRRGSVHELYSESDYPINIKGFLIDLEERSFPEAQLQEIKRLWDVNQAIGLDNALTNVFMEDVDPTTEVYRPVVINQLFFPESDGGKKHLRPFQMRLETDLVFTLEDE